MAIKNTISRGYRDLLTAIDSGAVDALDAIILYGNEAYLKHSFSSKLVERYVESAVSEFDLISLDDCTDAQRLINEMEALPLMSQKRVVKVNGFPGLENIGNSEPILKYLEQPNKSVLLLFVLDDIKKTSTLYKCIDKMGGTFNLSTLPRIDIMNWLDHRLESLSEPYRRGESYKKRTDTINELVERSGYLNEKSDIYELLNIITLACAFSVNGQVTPSEIAAVTEQKLDTVIWTFLDSVSKNDKGSALFMLENMLASGESVFPLLAMLIGQFELMLGIKELSAKGLAVSAIAKTLGQKSDFRVKKLSGFASSYSLNKLRKILLTLYAVDKHIKTGLYPESLALTMCLAAV